MKEEDTSSSSEEIEKYLAMGIPLEEAKRAMSSRSEENTTLSRIGPERAGELVNIECKILTINEREVNLGDEPRKSYWGFLVDDTGSLPYTSWRDIPYQKGDSILIKKGLVREWKGKAEIVINRASVLQGSSKEFKIISRKGERTHIAEVREPGWVALVGKILTRERREKNGKEFTRGVLGDDTGRMPFTSWVDFDFVEGDAIEVSGMVKSWLGMLSLNIGEGSDLIKSLESIEVRRQRVSIGELEERGGGFEVEVEGELLEVQRGSGLIVRCPTCRRAIRGNNCTIHGKVDGVWDLRLKGVLDDGIGNLSIIVGRDLCEKILEKTLDGLKDEAKDAMDSDVVAKEMEEAFLFKRYLVMGDVRSDEFGLRMIVKSIAAVEGGEPRDLAKSLLEGMG